MKRPKRLSMLTDACERIGSTAGDILSGRSRPHPSFRLPHLMMVLSFLICSNDMPRQWQKMASRAKRPLRACWI